MDNKKKPINKRLNKLFNEIQYEEPDTEPRKKDDKVAGKGESESTEINAQVSESASEESEVQTSDLDAQDKSESSEMNAQVAETEPGESEAQTSDLNEQGDEGIILTDASAESSMESPEVEKDLSPEDLLDEVRLSLIEVQEAEDEKPKWWQRFGIGSRKGPAGFPAQGRGRPGSGRGYSPNGGRQVFFDEATPGTELLDTGRRMVARHRGRR